MSAVGTQCGVRSTKTDLKNDKFEIKIPEFRGSAENSHACQMESPVSSLKVAVHRMSPRLP